MAPILQSTQVTTKTATKTQSDGSILKTITTTKTKTFSDGSTKTKVKVQTEVTPPGYGSNAGIRGNAYEFGYDISKSTAPRAAVTTSEKFTQSCLAEHNMLRAMHKAPPLQLNHELSKIAQGWANKIAKEGRMYHSSFEFGENLYWCSEDQPGGHAVKRWYDEIKDWDWKTMAGNGKGQVGHFTQLIWKRSKEIGVAAAYSKDGHLFVVVEYNPAGNYVGRYQENVFPK